MKTRKRAQVDVTNPLAPVRISPVRVNGTSVTNKGVEILNDDEEWECINIQSDSYNLIPNSAVQEVTGQILADSKMSWRAIRDVWTGRYWARLYKSDVSVKAPSVGDALSLGLRVENSYDGSCQFRLVLMAYVLSCTNGLVSTEHFTSYRMRHTRSNKFITSEAVSVLMRGMREVKAIIPMVEHLGEIPLTMDLLSKVSRETSLPNREWGHITKDLDQAKTAWDLMQAITHRLSHHGRGRANLQHQERIGDYFLDKLPRAAA